MCLGVPARVTAIGDEDGLRMGAVDFGGSSRRVCLAYVPEAALGDYVVVHAGFAIAVVDAAEAAATLAALAAIGED
ncbi:MAG TPA: HypC/HybG/HupF family hydrogenase formation chaperone [Candidatus Dormibacteraeota bacterium]|nr:HypC/HybG/HupF family hydrogenase formation chaperone [Candidatus Dormibacteraeota bacterium]